MFSFKLNGMKQGKLLESEQNYIVEQKALWKNIFVHINIQRVNWLKYYNKELQKVLTSARAVNSCTWKP